MHILSSAQRWPYKAMQACLALGMGMASPYMLALHCGSERKSAPECTAQCTAAALIATK